MVVEFYNISYDMITAISNKNWYLINSKTKIPTRINDESKILFKN